MFIAWFRKATSDREKVSQILVGEESQDILEALEEFDELEGNSVEVKRNEAHESKSRMPFLFCYLF